MSKVKNTDYLCLSAMLRAKEARMLTRDRMETMLAEASYADTARALTDCGYEDMSGLDTRGINAALEAHRALEIADVYELCPDKTVVDIFRLKYEYHNAKTLVKSSGAAESLAGIVLAQMIRPGTPVLFGVQSTAADMRGGITFACAAPEGTLMQGFAANMGKFYGLPSRGGGCQTDAPVINCQAGYESMLTFSSAYRHGINFVMEAGGVMDSVNATSFEKMMIDFEIIRQVKAAFTPIEVNEETLNLEEIAEIAHDGSFVTAENTLDNFSELYNPRIGSRNAKGADYFKERIDREMERLLKKYDSRRPELDPEIRERVKAVLDASGLERAELDKIDAM